LLLLLLLLLHERLAFCIWLISEYGAVLGLKIIGSH
jgi:hypothetical protein